MDAPPTEPVPDIAATPPVDAYEAFWQCVDANNSTVSSDAASSGLDAYEEFWDLFDAE